MPVSDRPPNRGVTALTQPRRLARRVDICFMGRDAYGRKITLAIEARSRFSNVLETGNSLACSRINPYYLRPSHS